MNQDHHLLDVCILLFTVIFTLLSVGLFVKLGSICTYYSKVYRYRRWQRLGAEPFLLLLLLTSVLLATLCWGSTISTLFHHQLSLHLG